MFDFLSSGGKLDLVAPLTGELVGIKEVPDEVFASKMVGDGLGIKPTGGIVKAPCAGKIVKFASAGHAIGIETESNIEILIHVGIDTVELDGEGFEKLATEGDKVTQGEELLKVDWDGLEGKVPSLISPVVITNIKQVKELKKKTGAVTAGEDFIMEVILN